MPAVGANVRPLLQAPKPPPPKTVLALLTKQLNSALTQFGQDVVLVLDDYHLIDHPKIHDGLELLLDYLPRQLHVVITSRAEPALSLARWRARNEVVELRAADLRFTPAESATFLTESMGLKLSPESIATLATKTEGWIAGAAVGSTDNA